jgi:hypothetical protein
MVGAQREGPGIAGSYARAASMGRERPHSREGPRIRALVDDEVVPGGGRVRGEEHRAGGTAARGPYGRRGGRRVRDGEPGAHTSHEDRYGEYAQPPPSSSARARAGRFGGRLGRHARLDPPVVIARGPNSSCSGPTLAPLRPRGRPRGGRRVYLSRRSASPHGRRFPLADVVPVDRHARRTEASENFGCPSDRPEERAPTGRSARPGLPDHSASSEAAGTEWRGQPAGPSRVRHAVRAHGVHVGPPRRARSDDGQRRPPARPVGFPSRPRDPTRPAEGDSPCARCSWTRASSWGS